MEDQASTTISDLINSFDQWRSVRKSRREIPPEDLCRRVRDASERYGAYRVRASIGLTKKCMNACLGLPVVATKRRRRRHEDTNNAAASMFSEVVLPDMGVARGGGTPVCVIETPSGVTFVAYSADAAVSELIGTFVANLHPPAARC